MIWVLFFNLHVALALGVHLSQVQICYLKAVGRVMVKALCYSRKAVGSVSMR
jgi:hypothetical protein